MSSPSVPQYCFVVEDHEANSFELEILPSDDRSQKHFQSVWQRLCLAVAEWHKIEDAPVPGWTRWKPWDWCADQREAYRPRQKFVAWCGSNQIGLLNVWHGFDSAHEPGKKVLYIEHMGAAPGNQNTELWNRRYRHVGIALLAFAVKLSHDFGWEGRVSLHAADEAALAFYRYVGEKFGPRFYFAEKTGITGPTPHSAHDTGLTYLEMTSEGANRLLEEYRRA